jgi:hypothetical protein
MLLPRSVAAIAQFWMLYEAYDPGADSCLFSSGEARPLHGLFASDSEEISGFLGSWIEFGDGIIEARQPHDPKQIGLRVRRDSTDWMYRREHSANRKYGGEQEHQDAAAANADRPA